jgi:hypothetical protein
MNSRYVNRFASLVALCAVCALALAPTLALAGGKGKGKSERSAISLSTGGNGGSNSGGGSSPSMKLHASRSKSLSSFGDGGNGGNGGSMYSQSLSTKRSKSLSQFNSNNSSMQNLYSTGGGNGGSSPFVAKKLTTDSSNSSPSGISRRSRKPSFTLADQHNLADAVQTGKFKPIDSGIGTGGGGNGGGTIKWPGKFTTTDTSKIADSLQKHKFPVEGIRIGEPNGPGNGNGNGNGKNKKDCDFPWWPIIVGGCYNGGGCNNGGYGGNCHHHHDCYDNYNGGCYNGGYYNNTVTYPSVTNIVIDGPAVDPAIAAQAALVAGVDLELLDVRMVDPGDAAKGLGSRYRLTFGNRGTLTAGNFQVMLMASVDGTPQAGAPSATSEISGLASRQVFAADVRLPFGTDLATMTKFIVVVDSAAQIGEPDENNNVALLDRAKIATVDATAVAVQ